jgi:hypothetical protein
MSDSHLSGPLNVTDALVVAGTAHFTLGVNLAGGGTVTGNLAATGNVAAAGGTITLGTVSITRGTNHPTSGTFYAGDIRYNSAPAAGTVTGWICTAAGTTGGTWLGFGTL